MRNYLKKMLLTVIMFTFVFAMGSVSSQAAIPSISTSKYIKSIATSKIYVYTTSSLSKRGTSSPYKAYSAYISSGDEVYIYSMNSTYSYISYPTSSGRKKGYVKTSTLTANNYSKSAAKSSAQITVYRKIGGTSYGYIAKNDLVYAVARSGNYTQVVYPAGSVYKMGWISNTYYDKYIGTTTATTSLTEKTISTNKYYIFYSSLSGSKVMDVNGNYSSDGTNIQLYDYNKSNAQIFKVTKLSSGWYKIINVNGKAIDVSGGVAKSGVNVQLYTYNGSDAQLWKFYDAGNGYYYIKNKLGYYLDVNGGYTSNGTNIQVYSLNYSAAQKWKLTETSVSSGSTTTTTTTTYYVTTSAGLILRKSASTSSTKLTTIPYQSAVQVSSITTSGGTQWAKCTYNGLSGYCSLAYLSTTKPTGTKMSYALYKSTDAKLTCGFDGYTTTKGRHEGIDFKLYNGASVYSLTSGTIVAVKAGSNGSSGLSTICVYDSSANKTVIYLHTNPLSSLKVGQTVSIGQKIGTEGWRGVSSSSGSHTHVEVRAGKKTSAAKSVNDYTLDNSNPTSYWTSKGYLVQ